MSSKESIFIDEFTGASLNSNKIYRETWRPALLVELMRLASPPHDYGLLGLALTQIEYSTYTAVPFQALNLPAEPAVGADSDTWSRYNHNFNMYRLQENSKSMAVGHILSKLDATAKELLRNQANRRYEQNLATILDILDHHFLPITRQELEQAMQALQQKYDSTKSIRAHLAMHRQLHNTFNEAGNEINNMQKTNLLVASLNGDQEVMETVRAFFQAHPNIINQNFDNLVENIESTINNRTNVATQNEFVNASRGMNKIEEVILENEKLKKEIESKPESKNFKRKSQEKLHSRLLLKSWLLWTQQ
jgi:hypothetical protein